MDIKDLTPAERFIWKWRRGRMGDFNLALIHLIQRADVRNLERIRSGFPDEVEGHCLYSRMPGWWQDVKKKMEGAHGG